jgi:hypothetical protein
LPCEGYLQLTVSLVQAKVLTVGGFKKWNEMQELIDAGEITVKDLNRIIEEVVGPKGQTISQG